MGNRVGMENSAATNYVRLYDNGNIDIISQVGGAIQISSVPGNTVLSLFANGNIDLVGTANNKVYRIGAPGAAGQLVIDNLLSVITLNGAATIVIGYIPGVPANWALPVPGDVWTALDRIAAAVVARTVGGPI